MGVLRAQGTVHPHTAAVTPESLRSCLGRGGIGGPRRDRDAPWGIEGTRNGPPPNSGGYTRVPPVLPGPRRERDAPWGIKGTRHWPPPHNGGYTRVPLVRPGPQGDRDAPWGSEGTLRTHPHITEVTPESLRSYLGRRGIGAPLGGMGVIPQYPTPHNGGYARTPPVWSGSRGDRDDCGARGYGATPPRTEAVTLVSSRFYVDH